MGTRSLINFFEDDEILATVYRQMDGYPEGRGLELAEFLVSMTLVNGICMGSDQGKIANGVGCLAAQWISAEKDGVGSVYIYPTGTTGGDEEYIYNVRAELGVDIDIEVVDVGWDQPNLVYFRGTPEALVAFIRAEGK